MKLFTSSTYLGPRWQLATKPVDLWFKKHKILHLG